MLEYLTITDIAVLSVFLAAMGIGIWVLQRYFRQPSKPCGAEFVRYPPKKDAVLAGISRHYGDDAYRTLQMPAKELSAKENLQRQLRDGGGAEETAQSDGYGDEEELEAAEGRAQAMFNTDKNDNDDPYGDNGGAQSKA